MEKIAIINSVYDYGSTGILAKELYKYGKNNGYEPFMFYGRGKEISDDNHIIRIDSKIEFYIHKILTLITGYQGRFSNDATRKLLYILEKEQIKKVILLNIHGYYVNEIKLLHYLRENNIKTLYITPDEYAGLGKCCYSMGCNKYKTECKRCPQKNEYPKSLFFDRSRDIFRKKKEAYFGFDSLTLAGPEANLVKFRESALVKNKKMKRISWGVDINTYKYEIDEHIYNRYDIPKDKVIILTVAKYTNARKGVKKYFFEVAKKFQDTKYHFINVGYDGDLKQSEIPRNMTIIGYINNEKELTYLYSISDLYLLASTEDTMPISCLISFACETPVCCFYTSGLKFLADKGSPAIKYCYEIEVEALEQIIKSTGKKSREERYACRKLAKEEYSIEVFNKNVYGAIEEQ